MKVSIHDICEQSPDPAPKRAAPRRLQVLVLDDEATDRMRLIRLMRRAGLEAKIGEVAEIAQFGPALDRQNYDIVFIDYWLGFENGLDALSLLTAHEGQSRAVPIMLSQSTEPQVIVEAMRAGCADYILKDELGVDTIRQCIASAFERRILLSAMRESSDLRSAIRCLVDRLSQDCRDGSGDADAPGDAGTRPALRLDPEAGQRLSAGLLADLERLWQMRGQ